MTTNTKLISCVLLGGVLALAPVALLRAAPKADASATAYPDGHYQLVIDSSIGGHYSLLDTRTGRVWTTQSNSGGWTPAMDALNDK